VNPPIHLLFNPMHTFPMRLVYVLTVLIIICSATLILFPGTYNYITQEDGAIEYSGFLLFLTTGILLLAAFFRYRKIKPVYLLVAAAIIFILAAGEEISWGQRIFGFGTPDEVSSINDQHEFNLHNIDKKFSDRLADRSIIFFGLLSVVCLMAGIKNIFYIPVPDGRMAAGIAFIPFYHQYAQLHFDFYHISYISYLLLMAYAVSRSDRELIFTIINYVLLSLGIMMLHRLYQSHFTLDGNCANEIRETILGIAAVYYALYIRNELRENSQASFVSPKK
jgi:hypothetical protein